MPGSSASVCSCGREQLGDPEIEQLHLAVGRHQDVAGLEIPVHDEILMGELDRLADRPEQTQPLGDGEATLVTVAVDRRAGDVLHGEVREPHLGDAGIEQLGDVGVLQPGQHSPLLQEAPHPVARSEPAFAHQLERHSLLHVLPLGQKHHAHPAGAQLVEHPVGTDPLAEGQQVRAGYR